MKNFKTSLILACAVSITFACSEKTSNQQEELFDMHEEVAPESVETVSAASVSFSNEETTAIINGYLQLKDELVATNGEKASDAAKSLLSVLEKSENQTKESLKKEVEKIANSSDPEAQRVAFDLVSQQMLVIAKSNEMTSGKLYKQYCPMAKNNTGAFWLSASEDIKNPYFGNKMLTCGSVEEVI
jgi:uncharacterized protein YdcH (DUF465 family)